MTTRLRQAVVLARDLDGTVAALRAAFGLAAPFADPGVALFGLRNAVFPVGDAFLEVVSPAAPGAPAARRDDGGYMAIFQTGDLAAVRGSGQALNLRAVWSIDLDDIAATHFHPADVGGAIVSVDQATPPSSWRWAGPGWEPGPGALRGITVAVPDPEQTRRTWGGLLGVDAVPQTTFVRGDGGIVAIDVDGGGPVVEVGSCAIR